MVSERQLMEYAYKCYIKEKDYSLEKASLLFPIFYPAIKNYYDYYEALKIDMSIKSSLEYAILDYYLEKILKSTASRVHMSIKKFLEDPSSFKNQNEFIKDLESINKTLSETLKKMYEDPSLADYLKEMDTEENRKKFKEMMDKIFRR